jgi:putative colanic acid biosynthesis UDP-glucose lipid carrier transferase
LNIKESTSLIIWVHRILDILLPIFTFYLITTLYSLPWTDRYQLAGILGGLLLVIFNQGTGAYSQWRGRALFSGFKLVIQAWIFTWLALLALAFLFKDTIAFSRIVLTGWAVVTPLVLLFYRLVLRSLLGKFRTLGWNSKKVAILGAGELGQRLAYSQLNTKMLGYIPLGYYDDDSKLTGKFFHNIPVSGSIEDFLNTPGLEKKYDEIYITLPMRAEQRIKEVLNALADSTITVKFIPDCFTFDLLHSHITDIGGIPIISVYDSPLNTSTNKLIKRTEDIILSVFILIVISPLLLAIAIGVKITSKGPALFKQKRVGWNGKLFTMYKFRSMPVNTEHEQVAWGEAKSKTTTKFGAWIRKTSLDELPQFFNTFRGDMSIVGPRPEREVFVEQFRKEIPRYMQKHMVKAGITGWAQVNGWRGDTSLEKRVEFDLFYIDHWSLWLDIKIILLTIVKGFINKNAY